MGRLLLLLTALICLPFVTNAKITNTLKQFTCKNGQKVQIAWKCDGEDDCGDGSDETDPECFLQTRPCTINEFTCSNKKCIDIQYKCDGEDDCKDGSDELTDMCKKNICEKDTFECEKGVCIPGTWVCDGSSDCNNGEDEKNCNKSCSLNEFTCPDGKCIEKTWLCDGEKDCTDGSDEFNCHKTPICDPSKDFICGDGKCIPLKFKCDGDADCLDKSDEINCKTSHNLCKENEFQCGDKKTCIHNAFVCDKRHDCPGGEDEAYDLCKNTTCPRGSFQCFDSTCIPGHLICDGIINCPDASDEQKCNYTPSLCLPEEMNCGGHCVHISKLCDGIKDCPNGEDEPEDKCRVNECLHKNGGCDHLCVDTTIGHKCECYKGYKIYGNSSCEDINECEQYGSCSQICHNKRGTFACSCSEGYEISPSDERRCISSVPGAKILYSRKTGILTSNLDGSDTQLIIGDTKNTRGMDFDYKSGFIFYTEIVGDKHLIYRSHMNNGLIRTVIVSNINKTENLAVDWVYDHIYWTDTGKNTIEMSNFDGTMRKTLIYEGLDEPRALALDPIEGYMFWSDWGKEGKIERSDMDGTHRTQIVNNRLKWPNGIALDLSKRRLYWADAKLYAIHSVNYDGTNRKEVKHSPDLLHHPFSLTLFEDWIYWTDWDTQSIYKADKFDGSNQTNVMPNKHLHDPMVVHVHHPYSQPRHENLCYESQCSHLCFPKPRVALDTIACACPDGLQLSQNGQLCGTIIPIIEESSTSKPHNTPSDTIVIDFEPDVESTREMDYAILIILIASGISLIILFIAFSSLVLYRLYLNGNIKIMNFDNPMYKKTATTDPYSAYNIEAQLSYPSTPNEEARHPLTSTLTMESTVYQ